MNRNKVSTTLDKVLLSYEIVTNPKNLSSWLFRNWNHNLLMLRDLDLNDVNSRRRANLKSFFSLISQARSDKFSLSIFFSFAMNNRSILQSLTEIFSMKWSFRESDFYSFLNILTYLTKLTFTLQPYFFSNFSSIHTCPFLVYSYLRLWILKPNPYFNNKVWLLERSYNFERKFPRVGMESEF